MWVFKDEWFRAKWGLVYGNRNIIFGCTNIFKLKKSHNAPYALSSGTNESKLELNQKQIVKSVPIPSPTRDWRVENVPGNAFSKQWSFYWYVNICYTTALLLIRKIEQLCDTPFLIHLDHWCESAAQWFSVLSLKNSHFVTKNLACFCMCVRKMDVHSD